MAMRLGGLDLHWGPHSPVRSVSPLLPSKPAGLAALIYRNQLHSMAAESMDGGKGGNSSRSPSTRSMESGAGEEPWQPWQPGEETDGANSREEEHDREHENKRFKQPGRDSHFISEPEQRGESFQHARFSFGNLDEDISLPFEMDQNRLGDFTKDHTTSKSRSGSQPIGQVRHQEDKELQGHLGAQRVNERGFGELTPGLRGLDWVPTPVLKLMKPYLDWSMGIRRENMKPQTKTLDVKPLKTNPFKAGLQRKKWIPKASKAWKLRQNKLCLPSKKTRKVSSSDVPGEGDFERAYFAESTWKVRAARRNTIRTVLGKGETSDANYMFQAEDFVTIAAALRGTRRSSPTSLKPRWCT